MTKLQYVKGDLFSAPKNSVLVHACNSVGSWGAGIALAFKKQYPDKFDIYHSYCIERTPDDLIGTCLLITGEENEHSIACLFTSRAYGKRKDSPEEILSATRSAVANLMEQNKDQRSLYACRFNSGKFAVPWEDTAKVLEELEVEMTIYDPNGS